MIALSDNAWVFAGLVVASVLAPTWLAWWNTHTAKSERDAVAAQMKPNGGSSLRDAIDRIERNLHDLGQRMVAVEEFITRPNDKESGQ